MRPTIALALLLTACGGASESSGATRPDAKHEGARPGVDAVGVSRASWGRPVPADDPTDVLAAELARDPGHPALLRRLDDAESRGTPQRERALWSLARIGGPAARDRLLSELDAGSESQALAAAALLEVPAHEPGAPPDPVGRAADADDDEAGPQGREEALWAALEDALWTRYAVTEPGSVDAQRALLLAIARVGGRRSVERFAVELADLPGPAHPPALVQRWSEAMRALGITCARGFTIDDALAATIVDGLERDDPNAAEAALYALSRCARSSGELLVESREALVRRLEPHIADAAADARPQAAALAWRGLAALGELPESVPAAILSTTPPAWTVEVEAVRALAGTAEGRSELRVRLRALAAEQFAGPRQHVLLAALQGMRGGIARDPKAADAELVAIGELLIAGRRGDDPRLRRASALGLCELRLLQAIRTGRPEAVVGCERVSGAPAIEPLPASWLANLEVEAVLRATRSTGAEGRTENNLGTAAVDEDAALFEGSEPSQGGGPRDAVREARIARLLAMARDPDPARASAAFSGLAGVDDPAVFPVLRAALLRDDPGLLAAASAAIAVRSVDASTRDPDVVPLLESLVAERTDAGGLEARLAAIEALGALARGAVASIAPVPRAPQDADSPADGDAVWLRATILPLAASPAVAVRRKAREALLDHDALLAEFDARELARPVGSDFGVERVDDLEAFDARPVRGLRVETTAGTFTVEFEGAVAPINQANLSALAKAGFYDGLGFHRVVPGFVVQGGDPRGDGYGGPGYTVPCEWSNTRYERGTVGIALAGKDTGGSQFFVTHTPQPHLDARYTVVGRVPEADMAVVDLLLPGDRIERVEVVYEAAR